MFWKNKTESNPISWFPQHHISSKCNFYKFLEMQNKLLMIVCSELALSHSCILRNVKPSLMISSGRKKKQDYTGTSKKNLRELEDCSFQILKHKNQMHYLFFHKFLDFFSIIHPVFLWNAQ